MPCRQQNQPKLPSAATSAFEVQRWTFDVRRSLVSFSINLAPFLPSDPARKSQPNQPSGSYSLHSINQCPMPFALCSMPYAPCSLAVPSPLSQHLSFPISPLLRFSVANILLFLPSYSHTLPASQIPGVPASQLPGFRASQPPSLLLIRRSNFLTLQAKRSSSEALVKHSARQAQRSASEAPIK